MGAVAGLAASSRQLARYTVWTASPLCCTAKSSLNPAPQTSATTASRSSRRPIAVIAKKGANNKKSKTIKKADLPAKICVTCGRPFTWRKKWETVWEEVKYCSDRCRSNRSPGTSSPSQQ